MSDLSTRATRKRPLLKHYNVQEFADDLSKLGCEVKITVAVREKIIFDLQRLPRDLALSKKSG